MAEVVKEFGGKSFLIDCNTMYPGSRKNALEHLHCAWGNDVPILPNLGMFASFDPLALDQACVDACLKAKPIPGSKLFKNMAEPDFVDHHDHFINSTPKSEWRTCLEHAAKIGVGTRKYKLIIVK